jgi:hypothetical protein
MLESARRSGFTLKPRPGRVIFAERRTEYFDRHRAIDQQMGCAIYGAHTTFTNQPFEPVFAIEDFADERVLGKAKCNRGFGL